MPAVWQRKCADRVGSRSVIRGGGGEDRANSVTASRKIAVPAWVYVPQPGKPPPENRHRSDGLLPMNETADLRRPGGSPVEVRTGKNCVLCGFCRRIDCAEFRRGNRSRRVHSCGTFSRGPCHPSPFGTGLLFLQRSAVLRWSRCLVKVEELSHMA